MIVEVLMGFGKMISVFVGVFFFVKEYGYKVFYFVRIYR